VSYGQDSGTQAENPPGRSAIGFRVRLLPLRSLSVMGNRQIMTTTTVARTANDWSFNTTSRSPIAGIGPALELQLGKRTTLTAEVLFDRLSYQKVTDAFSGTDDPTTGSDERSRMTVTESTKARLWDVPVILHHTVSKRAGVLSRLYVSAGITDRIVTTIRTTNDISYSDGTTASNHDKAHAAKSNLLGGVVGIGFRFMDDFNIRVTPEIRYTRWMGNTFGTDSTLSPRNQLEVGLAFTK
jgi:hypothetical protein